MKRSCFTLIELIMVIATIALLMAILAPALRNSGQQAKTILCSSNIRQLVLGLMMYENENETLPYGFHNTFTPPPGGYPGYAQYDRKGWWWFNYIEGFYKKSDRKKNTVQCPSKRLNAPKLKDNMLCGNYGVNQSICKSSSGVGSHAEFIGTPLRSSDISHPSQALLIVDSGYSMINWWHATDAPPFALGDAMEDTAYIPGLEINKDRNLWLGQEQDAINGRHPNKTVNVGFTDGHVSTEKADDLLVEKTGDGYKNRSPLWSPK